MFESGLYEMCCENGYQQSLYHTILQYLPHPKTLFLLKYYFLIFLYYFLPTVTFFQTFQTWHDSNNSTITNHHTTTTTPPPLWLHHHQSPHHHLHGSTIINHHTTTTTPPPKCFSLSSYTLHNQKTQTYFSRPAAIDERRGTHEPRHRQSTPITIGKKKQKTKNKTKSTLIKTQTPPPLDQCFLHH